MCALFGFFKPEFARGVDRARLFRHLARKSQRYGEKSFGLAGRKLSIAPVTGQAAAGGLEVVRYTGSASTWLEQNSKELKKYAALDVLIGHTRMPTHGAVTKNNCHPFPLGDWLVAHNGVIRNASELMAMATLVAKGETDSEEALCYVVSKQFSLEALAKIEGSFAFEAISRDGAQGWLICDSQQNLHVAKIGTGFVWCTDGEALDSSLRAAGVTGVEVRRMRSQILNLATGAAIDLPIHKYEASWGHDDAVTRRPVNEERQTVIWPSAEDEDVPPAEDVRLPPELQ